MDIKKKIISLPSIWELIQKSKLLPKKSLGQNFILDLNITNKIAQLAQCSHKDIIEIGPGLGSLTRSMFIEDARSIIAIEKDKKSIHYLSGLKDICGDKLILINGDALKLPLESFAPFPKSIIGNLPYNISTRLLTSWLRQIHYNQFIFIENITITIQKELADRIISFNGNKKYGRLSVFIHLLSNTQKLLELTPSVFYPEPKVFSSVISINPLKKPRYEVNLRTFEKITMLAFGQRRKMLRTSLKTIGGSELLKKADIDETKRPENLSTKDFCNLSNTYDQLRCL